MKLFSVLLVILFSFINCKSQDVSKIIEGGKTLVELIRVFKTPKQNLGTQQLIGQNTHTAAAPNDSCAIKQRSDLCYKNSSSKSLVISIYKKNGDTYEAQPFTMKVLSQKQECWYELKAGIYKYRIEVDTGTTKTLFSEGEFKLEACDNMQREITE
ncbi:MAG: hypothetical protein JSR97_11480 [Verrucomicrobia bacterium]|nr:hypothetical protein [Verrucomicrobiota bacterium]